MFPRSDRVGSALSQVQAQVEQRFAYDEKQQDGIQVPHDVAPQEGRRLRSLHEAVSAQATSRQPKPRSANGGRAGQKS